MTQRKILITGINGLIGKILTPALEEKYKVFGIDIQPPFSEKILFADISNYQQLKETVNKLPSLDYVIHLAADSKVSAPWDEVLNKNIIGTKNIYEIARKLKIKRVIFASSNHVTGSYEGFPPSLHLQEKPREITVLAPIDPDSDYGVSKAFGEALARYYYSKWAIESICLRIGTVISDDNPKNHPRSMKTWLSHRDLIHLIEQSITANKSFGIYYGVSNNQAKFWAIANGQEEIGYNPLDDSYRHKYYE